MNNGNTKKIILWIIGIAVVALVIWGMYKVASKGLGNEAAVIPVTILPSLTSTEHAKGNKEAKVTIIEYSDFECPACSAYYPSL